MSPKTFSLVAGVVFTLIALGHLLRIVTGGTLVILGVDIPMWASGLAVILTGFLAYQGFRLALKT